MNKVAASRTISDKLQWTVGLILTQNSIRRNVDQPEQGCSLDQYFCIEIFAGSGKLTVALRSLGLRDSFGFDVKLPDHLRCPIIKYDLLKSEHVKLVQDLTASPFCIYVHFAPPCGTSSRARLIQRRGRWNPPILCTDKYPDGLPGLTGLLKTRVDAANELYQVTRDLFEFCLLHKKYFWIENPGRSFMWLTRPFLKLSRKSTLLEVFFHHCRYGSARRKLTKLLHNIPLFQQLDNPCVITNTHTSRGDRTLSAIGEPEETTYPWALCRAIAAKLALQLDQDGFRCTPPVFALQGASLQTMRASTDIQPRRGLPPMAPEFKFRQVFQHPSNQALPPQSRKLTIHPGGSGASGSAIQTNDSLVTIGVHFDPEEFAQKALDIGHPTQLHLFFPDEMLSITSWVDQQLAWLRTGPKR